MLSNRFYLGFISYKGVGYPGQHAAILSGELFGHVQEMLRARDASSERRRKHPHYLKGALYYGECGSVRISPAWGARLRSRFEEE